MEIEQRPVLPIRECLRYGWDTFKKHPLLFAVAILIIDGLGYLIEYLGNELSWGDVGVLGIVIALSALAVVLQVVIMTNFMLRAHDAPETLGFADLVNFRNFWKLIGTMILSAIVIVIGLILLIIPGIVIALMLAFAGYIAVDKSMGPVASFKRSAAITKGNRLRIFAMLLIFLAAGILVGITAFFGETVSRIVQLIVDIILLPVMGISMVHAYRLLDAAHSTELAPATPVAPVVPPPSMA